MAKNEKNGSIHLDAAAHVDFLDGFIGYVCNAPAWACTMHEVPQLDMSDLDRGWCRGGRERMGELGSARGRGSVM